MNDTKHPADMTLSEMHAETTSLVRDIETDKRKGLPVKGCDLNRLSTIRAEHDRRTRLGACSI